ncbi:hypothetical protein N431DRAFT_357626, partial [Stipitochalara longipes BDJ]
IKETSIKLRKLLKYKTKQYLEKEERIKEALKAYHDLANIEITNLCLAASVFNVSYSILYSRDHGVKPLSENRGHNTRLNKAQEISLI